MGDFWGQPYCKCGYRGNPPHGAISGRGCVGNAGPDVRGLVIPHARQFGFSFCFPLAMDSICFSISLRFFASKSLPQLGQDNNANVIPAGVVSEYDVPQREHRTA